MGRGRNISGGGSRGRSVSRSSGRGFRSGGNRTTIIIGGGHFHDHDYNHGRSSKTGLIVAGIVFLAFAAIILGSAISGIATSMQYAPVEAKCLYNTHTNGGYYTTYEYKVKGVTYVNRSEEGWELDEIEGNIVTIYYNKNNPNKICEERPGISGGIATILILIGGAFVAVGVMLMRQGIRKKKDEEYEASSTDDTTPSGSSSEQYSYCSYCGSKISKDSTTCPRCGAGK